jgi:hypothetical protein
MTQPRPTKQRTHGTSGAKALITAASLALTIGGWAGLAHTRAAPGAGEPPAVAVTTDRPWAELGLDPLPTIVPAPGPGTASVPNISLSSPPISAPQAGMPAASVPLRPVGAPRPVARTRSSR